MRKTFSTERQVKAAIRDYFRSVTPPIHIQSMSSLGTNGTPDLWISGDKADLWVEVKFAPDCLKRPALSALQRQWLKGREAEGRNVMVLVAQPDGLASARYFGFNATGEDWATDRAPLKDLLETLLKSVAQASS